MAFDDSGTTARCWSDLTLTRASSPAKIFFSTNGTAYLVMASDHGRSLAEVLMWHEAEGHPFTEADLLAGMRPSVDGLVRVHAAGVPFTNDLVKRDLRMMELRMRTAAGSARARPEGSRHVAKCTVARTEAGPQSHRALVSRTDHVTCQAALLAGSPHPRPTTPDHGREALQQFGLRSQQILGNA